MLRVLVVIALCLFAGGWTHGIPSSGVTFAPLHLYYLSTIGSDANDGLAPTVGGGHGPWATPNHNIACGDVILVAAGTYSTGQFADNWGSPTGCPSTSGGIDGAGGIYFATVLCAGVDLEACNITTTGGIGSPCSLVEWTNNNQNNWAISGFALKGTTNCIAISNLSGQPPAFTTPYFHHHIAVINTVVAGSFNAFGANDGGALRGNGAAGYDYEAVVGMIAQNANLINNFQSNICDSQIDFVGPGSLDAKAGTHLLLLNSYMYAGIIHGCDAQFDGEAFMVDSPNVHLFTGTIVVANNIAYDNTRNCFAFTYDPIDNSPITYKIYNNTCYANNQTTSHDNAGGEINEAGNGGSGNWTYELFNNIMAVPSATNANGIPLYPVIAGGDTWTLWAEGTAVGPGLQNVLSGKNTSACLPNCAPSTSPFAEIYFNGNPVATDTQNTFTDPIFANTTDLLANQVGVPNCTGFQLTTQCMGWNAAARVMTTPSVISDLQASCAGCAGKGFQLPSTTCVASGPLATDYPVWLKGVGRGLTASGFTIGAVITARNDFVTIPCGM